MIHLTYVIFGYNAYTKDIVRKLCYKGHEFERDRKNLFRALTFTHSLPQSIVKYIFPKVKKVYYFKYVFYSVAQPSHVYVMCICLYTCIFTCVCQYILHIIFDIYLKICLIYVIKQKCSQNSIYLFYVQWTLRILLYSVFYAS